MKESRKLILVFIALFLCMFLPTYTSVPFRQEDVMLVYRDVFMQTSVAYLWLSPVLHVATVILIIALYRYGSKLGRVADAYFGLLFVFHAFANHITVTEDYGLAVMTGNIVQITIVGLFWIWDIFNTRNTYIFPKIPLWRYWVVPFAALAFWSPMNPDLSPNFDPLLLLRLVKKNSNVVLEVLVLAYTSYYPAS